MTEKDPRKLFILNALVNYFDTHEANLDKLFNHPSVNAFLDNGNARLLLASATDNGEILLCNEVEGLKLATKTFVFLKIAPLPITDENFSKLIMIASLQGGAAQSFYNSLDRLYGPLMMKNESKMMHQFPRLKLALSDLVSGLAACTKSPQDKDDQTPNVIFDLASEADYWLQKSRSSTQGMNAERLRSEAIYNALKPAVDATQRLELQAICTRQPAEWTTDKESQAQAEHRMAAIAEEFLCSLSEALETSIIDCLDGVWRLRDVAPPYPESRMRSLLEAVGGWLSRVLISYLNPLSSEQTQTVVSPLWDRPFKQVSFTVTWTVL
ncbi:unnamed protein product [Dibothriocephalus latus]|uniref:Dynein heavy chain tail domain-containing protein n=1 Tax=Dibothriocephalus latus TaxID=60516 RepID=A0A3P6VA05_DIBLA|nr:unnamed protein product [Dibothriocephalus latus]